MNNNHHHHSHSPSSSKSQHDRGQLSPYLVSAATSPRKKHTKTVISAMTGLHETTKTLPPLDINRTILHHHSTRRSARKSSRGHTVPVMQLGAASKRSHSAASNNANQDEAANIIVPGTPDHHISSSGRRSRQSPERKSSKVLYTPEKIARRGHILNKIETVRILRARPAFYPIKHSSNGDKVTISSNSNKSSAKSVRDYAALVDVGAASSGSNTAGMTPGVSFPLTNQDYMELPHNILGKHITLRMDRSEMKRKRGRALASLPPSTNLT